jgi:glycosyltransferase involved in cell wall biosynthesis
LTVKACARWSHKPTAIVVNSEAGRHHHERLGYRPRRWILIRNGIDTSVFRPDHAARAAFRGELQIAAGTILIGLIGRFDPMKDHEGFLRAAAIVARAHDNVHFVMAGTGVDGQNAVLTNLIRDLNLDNKVHLLGNRTDMPKLTAALDMAVSSSISEGFSNVLLEAMASGVACIATDVGDSRHIIGNTGVMVPPRDSASLAAALGRRIAAGPEVRAAAGRLARARVLAEFDLTVVVQRYEQLYASLAEERVCAA